MTSYIDTYLARITQYGETKAQQTQNREIQVFQKKLQSSPHRVDVIHNTTVIPSIILTDKEDANKTTMMLNVAVGTDLSVGDIVDWVIDSTTTEKWILYQRVHRANESHMSFYMVRCNYLLKWIDANGALQSSWAYIVSSKDSKVKGNYRTWNSLITPQPNKYMEILLPNFTINRGTRFIVNDEGWLMIEYDDTSVPGILYMSLTEEKVNAISDSTANSIADLDKQAVYTIDVASTSEQFLKGSTIVLPFTVKKNGISITPTPAVTYKSSDETIVDGTLKAVAAGTATITITLVADTSITATQTVTVVENSVVFNGYISGPDYIKLGRTATYTLVGNTSLSQTLTSRSLNNTLATIDSTIDTGCIVKANADNQLGSVVLSFMYNNTTYTKTIKITSLW